MKREEKGEKGGRQGREGGGRRRVKGEEKGKGGKGETLEVKEGQ